MPWASRGRATLVLLPLGSRILVGEKPAAFRGRYVSNVSVKNGSCDNKVTRLSEQGHIRGAGACVKHKQMYTAPSPARKSSCGFGRGSQVNVTGKREIHLE